MSFGGGLLKVLCIGFFLLMLYPPFAVYLLIFVDYYSPHFDIMNSPIYEKYHNFVVSRLPLREEVPIPELIAGEFSKEDVIRESR